MSPSTEVRARKYLLASLTLPSLLRSPRMKSTSGIPLAAAWAVALRQVVPDAQNCESVVAAPVEM
jgi:hypothetical protein